MGKMNYDLGNVRILCMGDESIWAFDEKLRSYYWFDSNTFETKMVIPYPENIRVEYPFSGLCATDKGLFLTPWYADDIYFYNFATSEHVKLNVPFDNYEIIAEREGRKQFKIIKNADYVFCICRSPDLIIQINPNDLSFEIIEFFTARPKHNGFACGNFFPGISENKIIIPYVDGDYVMYDPQDKSYETHRFEELSDGQIKIDIEDEFPLGFCENKASKAFYTNEGKIILFCEGFLRVIDSQKMAKEHFGPEAQCHVIGVFLVNKDLLVVYDWQTSVLRINLDTLNSELIHNPEWPVWRKDIRSYLDVDISHDNKMMILGFEGGAGLYRLDMDKLMIERLCLKADWFKMTRHQSICCHVFREEQIESDHLESLMALLF